MKNIKKYPELNSYDLAKLVSVITMITDHVGLYLFPDHIIFRIIGRISFPMFFFLIGYQKMTKVNLNQLFFYGIIFSLIIHYSSLHEKLFNILFVAFVTKIFVHKFLKNIELNIFSLGIITLLIILTAPITMMFSGYGGTALLVALLGYLRSINHKYSFIFYLITVIFCNSFIYMLFEPNFLVAIMMFIMNTATISSLYHFKIYDLQVHKKIKPVLMLISRYSLEWFLFSWLVIIYFLPY